MAYDDREKWDAKYAAIERSPLLPLEPWLMNALADRIPGTVLDVACGLGSTAIGLAQRGWSVTAVDISPVGLQLARQLVTAAAVNIDWICADLEMYVPEKSHFDVITVLRYLQRGELCQRLMRALKPGGLLIHATFLANDGTAMHLPARPRNPNYLLQPGELRALYPQLDVVAYEESPEDLPGCARFMGQRSFL